ncbi:type II toxin-antitoxin system HicA family toxin [Planktothrix agardhii]|uniref:type II toxin-antitoxin system HicA family toxin n=2 Tax=Planktothrix agardhii TaxID=1160 RepID=UPI001D0AABBA|nr:type II toxin-antitoxin system HicA family toxin [Planktothrix agardhii]MCB8787419.1 type II toxin-antitoxin system HicA family toxin [Planktothrix agardhii 1025]MCF3610808.1 type II toxin-antitoxin system HicA family toxin [Planktothrix agardhii 1027]MCF3644407.1 type II toxin-antitoxin system HicA family toxin [Planktothrix agardhii 1026]
MTHLLEKAFQEAQKLSNYLQDELAQQLLEDIENELKWQESLSNPDMDLGIFQEMAQLALLEDEEGMLQKAGFILLPNKRGKGSHSYWIHPLLPKPVVLSGKDSKDAKTYQEKDIMASIKELEQLEQGNEQ